MPLAEGLQPLLKAPVPCAGQTADGNEFVGAAADGRTHQDGAVGLQGLFNNIDNLEHGSGIGNGTASEF